MFQNKSIANGNMYGIKGFERQSRFGYTRPLFIGVEFFVATWLYYHLIFNVFFSELQVPIKLDNCRLKYSAMPCIFVYFRCQLFVLNNVREGVGIRFVWEVVVDK